ncbi:hypothetical protein BKA70DRAFT_1253388 [Coprinopsis sp. MPI-PUGE-AT-0042]|nr:hypothetical protein BKA70DRAFT_1253388 [Coprinopsis sp. MPI-PUGE-AT-0042]
MAYSSPMKWPQANRAPSPPALGPLAEGPFGGRDDPDDPEFNEDHELYWMYGERAGGWEFDFGKHRGQKVYLTSWSYLKFQYQRCTEATGWRFNPFIEAFERFRDGIFSWIATNYDDYVIPRGKHQGKRVYQCLKGWMEYILRMVTPPTSHIWRQYATKNDLLLLAIQYKLAHPHRQNVKRDIGESLSATKWYDEQDLLHGDDGDFEDPDEYEEEEGEDEEGESGDEDESQQEDSLSRLDKECEEVARQHQLMKAKEAKTPTKPKQPSGNRTAPIGNRAGGDEDNKDDLPRHQTRSSQTETPLRRGKRKAEHLDHPVPSYTKAGIDGTPLKRLRRLA